MIRIYRCVSIIILAIIFTGMFSARDATAKPGSCYLKAKATDVYVKLFDLNRDGDMGSLIWQGRINQGQEVLVTVPHARFRYYYNASPDVNQPMSGGLSRWCDSKKTVAVP